VPAGALAGRPHVVVDGAPRPGTSCTLSHWPRTPTPSELRGDTSAAIVLDALARPAAVPRIARRCGVATIDHLDEDGVLSLALLCRPELSERFGERMVAAAAVGDFGVGWDDDAIRLAFALGAALARDPDGGAGVSNGPHRAVQALELLPDLLAHPDRFQGLWEGSWRALEAAREGIGAGVVRIEEDPVLDLAVVRVDTDVPAPARGAWGDRPVHPVAIHSATACTRILTIAGPAGGARARTADLALRYETWVRLAAPLRLPRRLRVDLAPLAAALTERDGAPWDFPGAAALVPVLARRDSGPTTLSSDDLLALVREHLERADALPPAWDPWGRAPGAATAPTQLA
jgi:hypothetical protein